MESNIGTYSFLAEPSQMDFTGNLMLSVLGKHLLDSASMHAADCGFGMTFLNENHYTWVLSRLAVECNELPGQNEAYSIDTWIESVLSSFSGRNFIIKNSKGKAIGYARSVWAMIDMESRRPVNLLTLRDGIMKKYIDTEKECPINRPEKIFTRTCTPVEAVTVRYSDIDINGHLNSIRYMEYILNLFPVETFKKKRLKRFEISYLSEAVYGDILGIYHDSDETVGSHQIEMRKQTSGETACKAKVIFV